MFQGMLPATLIAILVGGAAVICSVVALVVVTVRKGRRK